MKKLISTALLISTLFLTACATNEHDAAIKTAQYKALTDVNVALNKPNKIECDAKCSVEIARENRVMYTAQMMQEFSAIDRLIAGGVSITEIVAKGVFSPATLQAYAMYKGLEVVSENGGTHIVNNDSYNAHSEANQANQQTTTTNTTTETVSGIKANGNVDQSQHNQNNPVSTDTDTNNSVNDSNNGGNDNSSTLTKEPIPAAADEVE